jgi:NAD-dependent deacetylase
LKTKKHIVVLSGAGISAESGLKTFRDSDGLWMGYAIEDVATPGAYSRNPQLVLDFYNRRRAEVANAEPNAAHLALAELEAYFEVSIITQNIDDLHERAGSSSVMHLHGEIFKMCSSNDKSIQAEIRTTIQVGELAPDGTQWRPFIVWFEEPVPMIENAVELLQQADIVVVTGTSLQVYPAAGLLQYIDPEIPVYVVDKKIPSIPSRINCISIEMPATSGMQELTRLLLDSINQ